jgi:hypothetical protein
MSLEGNSPNFENLFAKTKFQYSKTKYVPNQHYHCMCHVHIILVHLCAFFVKSECMYMPMFYFPGLNRFLWNLEVVIHAFFILICMSTWNETQILRQISKRQPILLEYLAWSVCVIVYEIYLKFFHCVKYAKKYKGKIMFV